jgi:hypothetical protein
MNTFTAQELADFYQKVADGGEIDYKLVPKDCFGHPENGPHMGCSKDVWRIKPTNKVIDLSVLIDGIDCEFKDLDADIWVIGKLHDQLEDRDGCFKFWKRQDNSGCWYDKCQPRMNHKHAWDGGDCPLPEGFIVKVWLRDDKKLPFIAKVERVTWKHRRANVLNSIHTGYDIIYFEVLRVADGYVMPWESE